MYKIFTKKMAFTGPNRRSVENRIMQCRYNSGRLDTINPKIKDLIKSCIVSNPEERKDINEILF